MAVNSWPHGCCNQRRLTVIISTGELSGCRIIVSCCCVVWPMPSLARLGQRPDRARLAAAHMLEVHLGEVQRRYQSLCKKCHTYNAYATLDVASCDKNKDSPSVVLPPSREPSAASAMHEDTSDIHPHRLWAQGNGYQSHPNRKASLPPHNDTANLLEAAATQQLLLLPPLLCTRGKLQTQAAVSAKLAQCSTQQADQPSWPHAYRHSTCHNHLQQLNKSRRQQHPRQPTESSHCTLHMAQDQAPALWSKLHTVKSIQNHHQQA